MTGSEFDLGDYVSFLHEGRRLTGTIVRVYGTRGLYHVEVDGRRYSVEAFADEVTRV